MTAAFQPDSPSPEALMRAYERLVCEQGPARKVTARAVASAAGLSVSSIAYHFGSMEGLAAAVGKRAYARMNLERVQLLEAALAAHAPAQAPLRAILDALVRPTIASRDVGGERHSMLLHLGKLLSAERLSAELAAVDNELTPHKLILDSLAGHAPWLSRAEIGWRLHAILGIRSHVLRRPGRLNALSEGKLDPDDLEAIIAAIIDVAAPMFAPPDALRGPVHRF